MSTGSQKSAQDCDAEESLSQSTDYLGLWSTGKTTLTVSAGYVQEGKTFKTNFSYKSKLAI